MEFPRQKVKRAGGIANVVSFYHVDSRSLGGMTYGTKASVRGDEGQRRIKKIGKLFGIKRR
jgi:hypothetical protein